MCYINVLKWNGKSQVQQKGPATEERISGHPNQSKHKSCHCCGATPSHPKKYCPAKDTECYKYEKKDTSRVTVSLRREKSILENRRTWKSKACKSSWTEGMSSSRTLDTAAVCISNILQYISSEWNPWSCISTYADGTSQPALAQKTASTSSCKLRGNKCVIYNKARIVIIQVKLQQAPWWSNYPVHIFPWNLLTFYLLCLINDILWFFILLSGKVMSNNDFVKGDSCFF